MRPRSPYAHISAPSRHGSRPTASTRAATNVSTTGSRDSTASTSSRSRPSTTRTAPVLSTGRASTQDRTLGDRDRGAARRPVVLLGEPHGLLDQRLHDLALRHRLDDLALDEDLALAVAGGDTEVGLTGFARPVDDAAHHGDTEGDGQALEARGHLLGEGVDVDLGAAAGRARDDLEAALPQVQRLEDREAHLDLLDRWGRQRDADGVAD